MSSFDNIKDLLTHKITIFSLGPYVVSSTTTSKILLQLLP